MTAIQFFINITFGFFCQLCDTSLFLEIWSCKWLISSILCFTVSFVSLQLMRMWGDLMINVVVSWDINHEPEDAWSGYRSKGALPLHLTGRSEQESWGQTGKSQHQAVRLTKPLSQIQQWTFLCFYWLMYSLDGISFPDISVFS